MRLLTSKIIDLGNGRQIEFHAEREYSFKNDEWYDIDVARVTKFLNYRPVQILHLENCLEEMPGLLSDLEALNWEEAKCMALHQSEEFETETINEYTHD